MLTSFLIFLPLGAVVGLLAGLLGVGGGLVIVPMITISLAAQGIDTPYNHHLAVGTSLATIILTSISSSLSHNKKGAVIWNAVTMITPGILVGTFLGAYFATKMPVVYLKIFFVIFLYYVGIQMLLNIKPKAGRELPGLLGNFTAGVGIGGVSSLVGIGGGTISVPYLAWCNVPIAKAIGTSAALGFPIALAGAAGYLYNGLAVSAELPPYCVGFIYIPAFAGIALVSVFTAPFGAKLAHKLPVDKLKKVFAGLLFVMGTQMLYKLMVG